jgi:predicted phage terminase large subunit-like protein
LSPLAEKKKKITLAVRTINHSEPSIAAIGALGNLVSAHYDLIIVDDLCNEDDRESPALREKKKRWFQDLFSVLSPKGQIVLVGTRWHFNDAYGDIITKLNPALPSEYKFKIRVESCYLEDGTTPRFPNILSANRLEALKTEVGPLLFACNYLNQPLAAEAQIFHLEDMVTTQKTKIDLSQTQAFGFCDPSGGSTDWSAIVTLLVLPDNTWVVFSSYFSHHAHSELITEIIRSHKFFNYKIFGIEGNTLKAKSDTAVSNFEHGVVVPYQLIWHNIPKDARIKSIEPYYVNGQLKFLDSWNADYPELITELVQFPLAAHNDGPDALEGVISLVLNQPKEPEVLHPRVR